MAAADRLTGTHMFGQGIMMELQTNSRRGAARKEHRKAGQKSGAGFTRPQQNSVDSLDMRTMRQAAASGDEKMHLDTNGVCHG